MYLGNVLTLYKQFAGQVDDTVTGIKARWRDVVNVYGTLKNGISQVRLRFTHVDGSHEIVGTVAYDPTDDYNLLFTPISATLPANTLQAITAIIDPMNVDVDSMLLTPDQGTRYLILNPIGSDMTVPAPAWAGSVGTNLIANANDIIEYNGNYWTVSFDNRQEPAVQYVTNLNTTTQYQWTGESWIKSVEGMYHIGDWSLVI
jgi:hypothetical protein